MRGRPGRNRSTVRHPAAEISTETADGVLLRGLLIEAPADAPVFVIGHGFTNSTAKPSTRAVVDAFGDAGAVVAFDFRGHGRSAGSASVGRDEVLDLDAAVAFALARGHRVVHVVGFSMGASAALRHAALGEHRAKVASVVSVSSPSRWYIRETVPMRRVHWLLEHPLGPAVGRLLGVRLGTPWEEIPRTPLELIDRIAPTPLLLVHGTGDHYFSPAHAIDLDRASAGGAELWIEDGMGHAESGSTPELLQRIAGWCVSRTRVG